eukprot:37504-Chlamydomonas_euryale.AAC.2
MRVCVHVIACPILSPTPPCVAPWHPSHPAAAVRLPARCRSRPAAPPGRARAAQTCPWCVRATSARAPAVTRRPRAAEFQARARMAASHAVLHARLCAAGEKAKGGGGGVDACARAA